MSTQAEELNLSGVLEPPESKRPARRPAAPRRPVVVGGLDLSGVLEDDAPRRPAAPRKPYSADESLLDGDWSPGRAEEVKSWFKATFGRDLPHRFGQTATHDRMGLDHSSNMDVQLSPQSEEGRALAAFLRENRIPFLAYNTAKPGAATGAHFHVGRPSRGLGAAGADELSLEGASESLNLDGVLEPLKPNIAADFEGPPAPRSPGRPRAPLQVFAEPGETFDPNTVDGRSKRNANRDGRQQPGVRRVVTLRVDRRPETPEDLAALMTAAILKDAETRGVPEEFAREWIKSHPQALEPVNVATQAAVSASEIPFDPVKGTVSFAVVSGKHIEKAWKDSRSTLGKVGDFLTDPTAGVTEKAVDAVGGAADLAKRGYDAAANTPDGVVAKAAYKTLGEPALKAVDAGDTYVMAKLAGYGDVTARHFAEMTYAGVPNPAENLGGEMLANVPLLGSNPRWQKGARAFGSLVLKPSNLVPLPEVSALLKAGKLGRAVEAGGELARRVTRAVGMADRGLVEAAPLGLLPREASKVAGEAADVVMRGADGTHYLVNASTGDVVDLSTGEVVEGVGTGKIALEARGYKVAQVDAPNRAAGEAAGQKVWRVTDPEGRTNIMRDDAELDDFAEMVAGPSASASDVSADPVVIPTVISRLVDAAPTKGLLEEVNRAASALLPTGDPRAGVLRRFVGELGYVSEGRRQPFTRGELETLWERAGGDAADIAEPPQALGPVPDSPFDPPARTPAGGGEPPLHEYLTGLTGRPLPADVPAVPAGTPPRSVTRRALGLAGGAVDAVKSNLYSADISAPFRQALFPLVFEPQATAKGLARGARSVFPKNHEKFVAQMRGSLLAQEADEMGLALASLNDAAKLEYFPSQAASRLPWVGASERAMSDMLDGARLNVYERLTNELRDAGMTPKSHPEEFRDVAHVINFFSGRGDFGRFGTWAKPALDKVLGSPSLLKSRFQVLDPREYVKLSPRARRIALRKAGRTAASLTGVLGLSALVADDVGWNPARGNFGTVRFGDTSYSALGGEEGKIRFIVNLVRSVGTTAAAVSRGEGVKYEDTPWGVSLRFLRSQLSPAASAVPDYVTGKDYEGREFTWTEAAARRLAPLMAQDLWDGYVEGGAVGSLKRLPAFVGVASRTFDRGKARKEWAAAREASRVAQARETTAGVLKDAPPEVREVLERYRVYLSESDAPASAEIVEAVRRAIASKGFQELSEDRRQKFLAAHVAAARKSAGVSGSSPGSGKVSESARIRLEGEAGEELKRVGLDLAELPKGERIIIPDGFGFEGVTGDSANFKGQHLGQTPEDLQRFRAETKAELERVVLAEKSKPDYQALTRERQKKYLLHVLGAAYETTRNRFLREARRREGAAHEGIEELQRRLEGRSRQVKPGETLKLGEPSALASPHPEMSAREPIMPDPEPGETAAEIAERGRPAVSEIQATLAGQMLDRLPEGDDREPGTFGNFVRRLDEYAQLSAVRPAGDAALGVTAKLADLLGSSPLPQAGSYREHARLVRALQLLGREASERPLQFWNDAAAGKYGEKMRARAERGGASFRQNRVPDYSTPRVLRERKKLEDAWRRLTQDEPTKPIEEPGQRSEVKPMPNLPPVPGEREAERTLVSHVGLSALEGLDEEAAALASAGVPAQVARPMALARRGQDAGRERVELVRRFGGEGLPEAADSPSLYGRTRELEEGYRATVVGLKGRSKRQQQFASEASSVMSQLRQVEARRASTLRLMKAGMMPLSEARGKAAEYERDLGRLEGELAEVAKRYAPRERPLDLAGVLEV